MVNTPVLACLRYLRYISSHSIIIHRHAHTHPHPCTHTHPHTHTHTHVCTYNVVKDFTDIGVLVKSNLQRNHRSLVARFLCGILPLEIETGRYTRVKRELRHCKICCDNVLEDETHFLLVCPKLTKVRHEKIKSILKKSRDTLSMSNVEKIKWLLQKEQIKEFGEALAAMYQARQDLLYSKK